MPATNPDAPESAATMTIERPRELPVAFATTLGLTRAELLAAPVRWPRPSRLAAPLAPASKKMAAGMRALGLETVGDLLEHLPTDSRQARTVGALRDGEQATVAVEVRAIAARAVRRRGMRPLVAATVFDATGSMRATFFNQPWLVERYAPGTRVLLHGKPDARGGFRVSNHAAGADLGAEPAVEGEVANGGAVAHYPAAEGVTSTQILTLVQGARDALGDIPETLSGAMRAAEGLPDRACALAAMHFPRAPEDVEEGRRRLAFEELLLGQLVFLRRRAGRRELTGARALAEEPQLTERWLRAGLPFAPTGDQLRAVDVLAGDLAQPRPMQRLLMGEVGSGKTVVALYAMLRAVEHGYQAALMAPTETLAEQHFATIQALLGAEPVAGGGLPGGVDGADRDARRTALRHDPGAARRRARGGGAAHGLDPSAQAPRHPRQAGKRRAGADRGHPRADRARRALRRARRRGERRAASIRRAPARGAGRAAPRSSAARAAHDGHADSAHARARALRRP